MSGLLDKEVVKYTRDGMQKQNLATGETEILTQSDYSKQIKYQSHAQHVYNGKIEPENPSNLNAKKLNGIKRKIPCAGRYTAQGKSIYSEPSGSVNREPLNGASETVSAGGNYAARGKTPRCEKTSPGIHSRLNAQKSNSIGKNIYSGKVRHNVFLNGVSQSDGGSGLKSEKTKHKILTHMEIKKMKKGKISSRIYESNPITQAADNSDNLGVQTASHAIRRSASKAEKIKTKIKRKFRSKKRKKNKKAAAKAATKTMSNPVVQKAILIILIVFLIVHLVSQISNQSLTAGAGFISGSTTEHPELTTYTQQLDSDFLSNIDALKTKYAKGKNNVVTVDGDEAVDTNPNVLAILATGDWTNIDLTEENKANLAGCHKILNTYTVSTYDEKSTDDSGETSTTHHITIIVHVYTAKEKIDSFHFSDAQKKHVLEMLDVLDGITSGLSTSANSADSTSSANYTGSDSASTGEFIWPLPGHTRISSGYGVRVDPITGKSGAFHTGIDIPAPTGTLILASASGTVSFAGVRGGYGNCVILNHGNGLQTLYGHGSALLVKKGDTVTQGQAIAKVGQTGRATGAHLHFEVRVNNVHTDPTPYLKGASKK